MVDPLTRTASAAVRTQCLAARRALHIRMHRLLSVGDAFTAVGTPPADNWQADSSRERCVLSAAYTTVVVECRTRWRQLAGLGLGARAATHLHHASRNHEQGDDDGGPHRHLKALLDEVSGCRAPYCLPNACLDRRTDREARSEATGTVGGRSGRMRCWAPSSTPERPTRPRYRPPRPRRSPDYAQRTLERKHPNGMQEAAARSRLLPARP